MTALSTSLDKLGNLKQLRVDSFEHVALQADALSSLSPPFRNLELLDLQYGCTFSRVPRWMGHLHNLRELFIGVKQVLQEDVAFIGTWMPSLILSLRIPGVLTERIVIGGSTGFPVLRWFLFDCDGVSFLTFEAGAMPALRELELALDADQWDKAAPAGLQHLPSLETITTWRECYTSKQKAAGSALIMSVFQEAADTLPTRPKFNLCTKVRRRPTEED
ncbi:disease resistance protein RGA5-like [Panicum virgatum]|nr:disease resistance protein RGA5-like [Panicum virgatum]